MASKEIEFATTVVNGDDANVMAAGVAGERILVLGAAGFISNVAAGTCSFLADTTPIAELTGVGMANPPASASPTAFCMPYTPVGWFRTVDGEDLVFDSDTAAQVGTATITFIRVPA